VLREANSIPPKMRLRAGSTILVPKTEATTEANITAEVADNAKMMIEPDVADTRKVMFKVGKRDSLASIAAKYKVSVADLKSWNSLQRDQVSNGQRLQIQVPVLAKHSSAHSRHTSTKHATARATSRPATVLAHAKPAKHGKRRVG
jgi:membrane-bound lytic murein transglycosylase D